MTLLANRAPDRFGSIAGHFHFTVGANDLADPGPEHAQVVVDFGDRAHGAATTGDGIALLDGNGGADAVDPVDIRLGQAGQELAGVGGQGFHVTALTLGVQGVENQGRFARAREARNRGQHAPGKIDIDVLQIVLAGAFDPDPFGHVQLRLPFAGSLVAGARQSGMIAGLPQSASVEKSAAWYRLGSAEPSCITPQL